MLLGLHDGACSARVCTRPKILQDFVLFRLMAFTCGGSRLSRRNFVGSASASGLGKRRIFLAGGTVLHEYRGVVSVICSTTSRKIVNRWRGGCASVVFIVCCVRVLSVRR